MFKKDIIVMKQPNYEQEISQWKSEDRRLVEPKVP